MKHEYKVKYLTGKELWSRFEIALDHGSSFGWEFVAVLPSKALTIRWLSRREA